MDQIAILHIIVEQSLEWNSPLYINFVDYEKAFDSFERPFGSSIDTMACQLSWSTRSENRMMEFLVESSMDAHQQLPGENWCETRMPAVTLPVPVCL